MSTQQGAPIDWTRVARIVFPPAGEEDTLPLYVDFGRTGPIKEQDGTYRPVDLRGRVWPVITVT